MVFWTRLISSQPLAQSEPKRYTRCVRSSLYQTDFRAWAIGQAEAVRLGAEIDSEHVAEELESLGNSQEQQLTNRLAVVIAHLLKWEHQADKRSRSWRGTILEQRKRIDLLLRKNPSLKSVLSGAMDDAYAIAVTFASSETGIVEDDFPGTNPYSLEQLMTEKID